VLLLVWQHELLLLLLLLRAVRACRELLQVAPGVGRVGVQDPCQWTRAAAVSAVLQDLVTSLLLLLLLELRPMVCLLLQPCARPWTCPELLLLLVPSVSAFLGTSSQLQLVGTPRCALLLPALAWW
jgi:hypothetical protein